jgi:LmbE family N-acetylglucosaminyl deacetylase
MCGVDRPRLLLEGCLMKILRLLAVLMAVVTTAAAQTAAPTPTPPLLKQDERLKVDVLLVVAHPDDETGVIPYLVQLIDQHKHVAVVYTTHGEAGHNNMGPERARSLGLVREMELRHALERVGINNVWFLSGRDTPSQNVLESLANWGNGQVQEDLIRMVRLTRPEVIVAWMPGFFIGENHGDHQASGVLATEAFDMAGDPTVFPAQLAGPVKVNETLLDGLQPWQAKKLYYFPDSGGATSFKGTGPTYQTNGISAALKIPYWRAAFETFKYHLTQYRSFIEGLNKMDEKQVAEQEKNWGGEGSFTLGKSLVPGSVTGDVFEGITSVPIAFVPPAREPSEKVAAVSVGLSGPWGFYEKFWRAHGLKLPRPAVPEISIKHGLTLTIPLELHNHTDSAKSIAISVKLPEGWSVQSGTGNYSLEPQSDYFVQVLVDSPKGEVKGMQEIDCRAEAGGKTIGDVKLAVRLVNGGLPQN